MKTETLKKALDEYGFDMIYGGARRISGRTTPRTLIYKDSIIVYSGGIKNWWSIRIACCIRYSGICST